VSDPADESAKVPAGPTGGAARKPVILAVDDEPHVLSAVALDLRRRFRGDYRILTAGSGAEALDAAKKLRQRGDVVALFLVDQRMPGMTGTELLAEARKVHPEARKVLLTAYADTEAAIVSINQVGLDHYLMKPWDPPEQNLYPVLDELLADWAAAVRAPWDGIRVVGTLWSAASHAAKDYLARNRIPYRWLDLDRDPEAKALLATLPAEQQKLPLLFFPDGAVLSCPDRGAIAQKIGHHTQAARQFYDLVVIGGGPAGLAAAVYGASEGLKTVLIEREATGGQAGTSSRIENYLGFPNGLSGTDLAQRATAQARRFGAELLAQEVTSVRVSDPYRTIVLGDGGEIACYAVVVAPGVTVRTLDVPGADRFTGAGVYYGAALTEAAHYRDQDVIVIGGANSAGQGAVFFAHYARRVTMLVRGKSLAESMSQYLVDQIAATPNIDVLPQTEVVEVQGGERMEGVILRSGDGGTQPMPAAAIFVFIGATPRTELFEGVLARDPGGYILTGLDLVTDGRPPPGWTTARLPALLETSVPGIFAAGDVRHGSSKRVAAAVGEGAVAVQLIHQYLKTV
jgi:thioredoxin reductase (NADPH)